MKISKEVIISILVSFIVFIFAIIGMIKAGIFFTSNEMTKQEEYKINNNLKPIYMTEKDVMLLLTKSINEIPRIKTVVYQKGTYDRYFIYNFFMFKQEEGSNIWCDRYFLKRTRELTGDIPVVKYTVQGKDDVTCTREELLKNYNISNEVVNCEIVP